MNDQQIKEEQDRIIYFAAMNFPVTYFMGVWLVGAKTAINFSLS